MGFQGIHGLAEFTQGDGAELVDRFALEVEAKFGDAVLHVAHRKGFAFENHQRVSLESWSQGGRQLRMEAESRQPRYCSVEGTGRAGAKIHTTV